MPPFHISVADTTLFGPYYKLSEVNNNGWWSAGCFIPYEEWKRK